MLRSVDRAAAEAALFWQEGGNKDLLTPACYAAVGMLTPKLCGQHRIMWMRSMLRRRMYSSWNADALKICIASEDLCWRLYNAPPTAQQISPPLSIPLSASCHQLLLYTSHIMYNLSFFFFTTSISNLLTILQFLYNLHFHPSWTLCHWLRLLPGRHFVQVPIFLAFYFRNFSPASLSILQIFSTLLSVFRKKIKLHLDLASPHSSPLFIFFFKECWLLTVSTECEHIFMLSSSDT